MGINVFGAAIQAGALENEAIQLQNAKRKLEGYKMSLTTNWTGTEVAYMVKGINSAISELNTAIAELNQLATDIKNTANTILQEEVARQNRINDAQKAYDAKQVELNICNYVKGVLDDQIKNPSKYKLSAKEVEEKKKELSKVKKQITQKRAELATCATNLDNARRS